MEEVLDYLMEIYRKRNGLPGEATQKKAGLYLKSTYRNKNTGYMGNIKEKS
jgi:hypothetical protein